MLLGFPPLPQLHLEVIERAETIRKERTEAELRERALKDQVSNLRFVNGQQEAALAKKVRVMLSFFLSFILSFFSPSLLPSFLLS